MKTLSIKQPWASLIAHGIKNIENRTWASKYRGRIYIHASATYAAKELQSLLTYEQFNAIPNNLQNEFLRGIWKRSAIIGEVDIVDCVINHPSIWAQQSGGQFNKPIYNWVLANPVLYDEPILNVKGKLSLWEFDRDLKL